ncbi:hypothetical protein [Kineococcus sp. SYSU DK002]|uniref:hypothetical protein n=1 Tax=Kineococcus sp. SYSU DK002 TaxID=3383123 RepID=UPI003D7D3DE6
MRGPISAFAVASLRVNNPDLHNRTPQLLLETGEGIAWRLLADLHPLEAGPGPNLNSLFLSPSGQTLLGRVPADGENTTDGRRYTPRTEERLVLIDVATGRQRPTPFTRRGRTQQLHYGLAPNERDLAVADTYATAEVGRITVSVLRGPDLAVSAQRVFERAYMRSSQRDAQLQWSPDGRLVALWMQPPGASCEALLVLDAATLETVLQVEPSRSRESVHLGGSASWSPDSQRLVIVNEDYQRILHLGDGRQEKPAWLNGPRGDPPRQAQILGLLPDDRVLVQRQRGTRLRLSGVDLATGKGPVLADVAVAENDAYLQMAVSRQWEDIAPTPRRRAKAPGAVTAAGPPTSVGPQRDERQRWRASRSATTRISS